MSHYPAVTAYSPGYAMGVYVVGLHNTRTVVVKENLVKYIWDKLIRPFAVQKDIYI